MIYFIYSIVSVVILLVLAVSSTFAIIGVVGVMRWLYKLRIPTFKVAKVLPIDAARSRYWNKVGRIISITPEGNIVLRFIEIGVGVYTPTEVFTPNQVVIYNNEFRDLYEANRALNSDLMG